MIAEAIFVWLSFFLSVLPVLLLFPWRFPSLGSLFPACVLYGRCTEFRMKGSLLVAFEKTYRFQLAKLGRSGDTFGHPLKNI